MGEYSIGSDGEIKHCFELVYEVKNLVKSYVKRTKDRAREEHETLLHVLNQGAPACPGAADVGNL